MRTLLDLVVINLSLLFILALGLEFCAEMLGVEFSVSPGVALPILVISACLYVKATEDEDP
jgi:hypothetical protein